MQTSNSNDEIFSSLIYKENKNILNLRQTDVNIVVNKVQDKISVIIEFKTLENTAEITFTKEQFEKFISYFTPFSNAFIHTL